MEELRDFNNIHNGEKVIILGLGDSLDYIFTKPLENITLIGVNDICRKITPKYLVVVDKPFRFTTERMDIINNSKVDYAFTYKDKWVFDNKILLEGFSRDIEDLDYKDTNKLVHGCISPFDAVTLAYRMGFKDIGVLGVDITLKDHGVVKNGFVETINKSFKELHRALNHRGVNLYNLSDISDLKTIPYKSIKDF